MILSTVHVQRSRCSHWCSLSLFLLLLFAGHAHGQNKTKAENQRALDNLVNGLQQNPENPLGIDQNFLNELSQLIEDETLKTTLQGYGKNLGDDKDLSVRQI